MRNYRLRREVSLVFVDLPGDFDTTPVSWAVGVSDTSLASVTRRLFFGRGVSFTAGAMVGVCVEGSPAVDDGGRVRIASLDPLRSYRFGMRTVRPVRVAGKPLSSPAVLDEVDSGFSDVVTEFLEVCTARESTGDSDGIVATVDK